MEDLMYAGNMVVVMVESLKPMSKLIYEPVFKVERFEGNLLEAIFDYLD